MKPLFLVGLVLMAMIVWYPFHRMFFSSSNPMFLIIVIISIQHLHPLHVIWDFPTPWLGSASTLGSVVAPLQNASPTHLTPAHRVWQPPWDKEAAAERLFQLKAHYIKNIATSSVIFHNIPNYVNSKHVKTHSRLGLTSLSLSLCVWIFQ